MRAFAVAVVVTLALTGCGAATATPAGSAGSDEGETPTAPADGSPSASPTLPPTAGIADPNDHRIPDELASAARAAAPDLTGGATVDSDGPRLVLALPGGGSVSVSGNRVTVEGGDRAAAMPLEGEVHTLENGVLIQRIDRADAPQVIVFAGDYLFTVTALAPAPGETPPMTLAEVEAYALAIADRLPG